jgi:hydrogenase nickel incorporation protein HypA/HybF
LEAVARRAGGRTVTAVGVRIGCLHRVVAEAFAQSFALAASGTTAADAEVALLVVPAHARCRSCAHDFDTDDPGTACTACGSFEVTVTGGDDVVLEWLRYDDGHEAATEPVPAHSHPGGA